MDSPVTISTECIRIIKSYGCDNIIKCVIEPRTWLSYNYFGMTYAEGLSEAETLMKSYFDGNNSSKKKISFDYPRPVEVRPSGGPTCESTLVFSAPLPNKGVEAPKPVTSDLVLDSWPTKTVYARPFLGPATEDDFRSESIKFSEELTTAGLKFKPDPYYWTVIGPSNEQTANMHIWFLADD